MAADHDGHTGTLDVNSGSGSADDSPASSREASHSDGPMGLKGVAGDLGTDRP
jgi:hypothetical protein